MNDENLLPLSHASEPPTFRGLPRWIARLWPSSTVVDDPLRDLVVEGRYSPIPLAGWKLTPSIRRHLLGLRRSVAITLRSDARLGVIVPVRDREHQLVRLIPRLSEELMKQGLDFRILVVEQSAGSAFNKGALVNAGFRTLSDRCDYVCIHDVDAIPVEADYRCPSEPLRLVTHLVDSRHGARRGPRYFSGAISIRCEQFVGCNGFSNEYWGWGKEDDDFLFRLLFSGRICFADQRGTFEDLPNPADQQVRFTKLRKPRTLRANRRRRSLLMRGLVDFRHEGLNSLRCSQSVEKSQDGYSRIVVTI